MRLWRVVLEAGRDVWTFLVASRDPFVAVDLARGSLPDGRGDDASLEDIQYHLYVLALHRHLGTIPESAGRVLEFGIGQRDAERWATVRRAVATTA